MLLIISLSILYLTNIGGENKWKTKKMENQRRRMENLYHHQERLLRGEIYWNKQNNEWVEFDTWARPDTPSVTNQATPAEACKAFAIDPENLIERHQLETIVLLK